MNPYAFTAVEELWFWGLLSIFGFELVRVARQRDPLAWYQPTVFAIAFLFYYCVLGPLDRLSSGNWIDRGIDLRYGVAPGLAGATLFFLSLLIGYHWLRGWRPQTRFIPATYQRQAWQLGQVLCWLGIGLFSLGNGPRVLALLNPFTARIATETAAQGIDLGALANYANNALNLMIPGILLLFASWIQERRKTAQVLIWTVVALGLFTSIGFRYRLVILLVPMIVLWFLGRQRRPSVFTLGLGGLGLLVFSGLVGLTRAYGRGLDLSRVEGFGLGDLAQAGLQETHVFLFTGAVIANSPAGYPFVGLQPLLSTLLMPIPRALLPDKSTADYIFNAVFALFPPGLEMRGTGVAFLGYAEYYLMAGWPTLILMGIVLGWLLRCLWNWFSPRRHEVLAQVAYVASVGYLYVVISRGYLPQVVTLFVFGVAPLFWLYYRQAKPIQSLAAPSRPSQVSR